MSIKKFRKEKELEREEISQKFENGQSFEEHIEEKNAFDLGLLRKVKIVVKSQDGEKIVLEPKKKP